MSYLVLLTIIRQKEEAEVKEKAEREAKEKAERKERRRMRKATQGQPPTQSVVYVPISAPPGMIATGPLTPPPSDAPTPIGPGASSGYESDGSSDSESDTRSLTTANDAVSDNETSSPSEKWVAVKTAPASTAVPQDAVSPPTERPAPALSPS